MFSMTKSSKSLLLLALAWQCLLVLYIPCVSGQEDVDESLEPFQEECPEPNGFYADRIQCDRYYECKDSQVRVLLYRVLIFRFFELNKIA